MARQSAFGRSIEVYQQQITGPARQELIANIAREALADAQQQNRAALGQDAPWQRFVDGVAGAPEEAIKPGGQIIYLFDVGSANLVQAVDEAIALILQLSPVKTGRYKDSNLLQVNGSERDADIDGRTVDLALTDVVSLVNLLPYARRIENGWSSQAPNGVYETTYSAIKSRYGNVLTLDFAYVSYPGYEVGKSKKGGKLLTRGDFARASAYPTITLSVR